MNRRAYKHNDGDDDTTGRMDWRVCKQDNGQTRWRAYKHDDGQINMITGMMHAQ
jgi:hypothetical protein